MMAMEMMMKKAITWHGQKIIYYTSCCLCRYCNYFSPKYIFASKENYYALNYVGLIPFSLRFIM